MSKKTIIMVGATDRFNYGDLLFPHITQKVISLLGVKHGETFDFVNVSTLSKKCSKWGGIDTQSMSTISKIEKKGKEYNILVIGGGVLAVDWLSLYSMVSRFYYFLFRHRRYGKRWIKYITRPKEIYPFYWDREKNKGLKNVFYLSVGDTIDADRVFVEAAIKNSDYFSVRTYQSRDLIINKSKVEVVPDTAILMSSLFQKELERACTSKKFGADSYVFFQISLRLINEIGVDVIAKELTEFNKSTNAKIILCSIGTAYRHSDEKALSMLSQKLEFDHELVIEENIWTIMSLIANSELYIGSSLHGLITAMSFGVPYVGFTQISKQLDFVKSWSIDDLQDLPSAASFATRAIDVFSQRKNLIDKILLRTSLLKLKVYRSYIKAYRKLL